VAGGGSSPALPSILLAVGALAVMIVISAAVGPAWSAQLQFLSSSLLLATVGLAVLLVALRGQIARHVGYLMMLFGAVYWFIIPALSYSLSSDRFVGDRYGMHLSPTSLITATFYIWLYVVLGVLAYWICDARIGRRVHAFDHQYETNGFYGLVFGLFIAGFVPYLLFGGGWENTVQSLLAGRWEPRPWKSSTALGDHRSAIYYLSISGFVAAGGFAGTWAVLSRKCAMRWLLLAMLVFTALIVYLDGGSRSWVALACVPTCLAWFAATLKKNWTLGKLIVMLVVVCGIQFSFDIVRQARTHGWSLDQLKSIDYSKRYFDNDFFTDLAVCVDLVPRRHDYFYFGDALAFLTHPVPRFMWKDKPIPPVLLYYNSVVYVGLLGKEGNKLPSHIGQFHMSLGATGVVLLAILSGIISSLASALMRARFLGFCQLGSLLVVWWFLMARGVYPGWTYPVAFGCIIVAFGFRRIRGNATEANGRLDSHVQTPASPSDSPRA
jgi:hypothetical protein